ncbi:MAG: hypothetical protein KDH96_05110 [Candidatus Riesia sp.]|nr:hypothetical protein [Candidatus Riesia sp.]
MISAATTFLLIVTTSGPIGGHPQTPIIFSQPDFVHQNQCLKVGTDILNKLGPSFSERYNVKATCHEIRVYK